MKKVLFAIAAMAACVSASAQLWLGGVVGFGNTSYYTEGAKSSTQWRFAPTVGYALDDKLDVGLKLDLQGTSGDTKYTSIGIKPFVRYTFFSAGDFSFFADGQVGYNYNKYGDGDGTWNFVVSVNPGIKYQLSEHFTVAGMLYGEGLFFRHYKEPADKTGTSNQFGLECGSSLNFGLFYTF